MLKEKDFSLDGDIIEESTPDFVRRKIATEEKIYDLAELFKVFGDSTRTKILCCLEVKDLYVGELAEVLNMSISAVSHQLRVLRNAKLVRGVKEGKEVKYSLDDNHVMMIISCGLTHLEERD
jgi:ArsR family transcriptional regulator